MTPARLCHAFDTLYTVRPALDRLEALLRRCRTDPRLFEPGPASARLEHQIERLKRLAAPLWAARHVQFAPGVPFQRNMAPAAANVAAPDLM